MEFEGSNILRRTSWYLGHLALSYIYLVDTENAECANCNIKDEQVRFLQLYFSWQWHNVCFPFNLYGALVLFIRRAKNLEILFIWAKFFGTSHRWRTFCVVETRKFKFSSICVKLQNNITNSFSFNSEVHFYIKYRRFEVRKA